jgi:TrmH RNA methyltransferase
MSAEPDVICGLNAVAALMERRPDDALRLFYTETRKVDAGPFASLFARARRPYRLVEPDALETIAGTAHHGGIAVVAKPRAVPIWRFDAPHPAGPVLLVLDGIGNPHNLGAIVRSAAFFGVRALLLGEGAGNAMPSNAAYRVAEGGFEYLDLYRSRDLPAALAAMTPHRRTVAATLAPDAVPVEALPQDRPIALVLGNEERGISAAVRRACRRAVRIEGPGAVQSLNVAQAAAILLHHLAGPRLPSSSPH